MNATGPIQQGAPRRPASLIACAIVLTAACGDSTGPEPSATRVALAAFEGTQPALFLQDLDGTNRSRIHFAGVSDNVPGNLPPFILPVQDGSIRAIGPIRWSADGSRLAAIMSVAFDQSQIVVMNDDGSEQRTASVNTQVITSDIAWAPDGTRIAYTMSTTAGAGGIELFITELASSRVTALTDGAGFGGPGVALAWSADGTAVIYSEITETGPPPLNQRVSRINSLEIATGKEATLALSVTGEVFGISTDGERVVLVRRVGFNGSEFVHDVVLHRLADGIEAVLLDAPEPVAWASITGGQEQVIVATPSVTGGLEFRMYALDGGGASDLEGLDATTGSVDVAARR